jgi:hypothetical protein
VAKNQLGVVYIAHISQLINQMYKYIFAGYIRVCLI